MLVCGRATYCHSEVVTLSAAKGPKPNVLGIPRQVCPIRIVVLDQLDLSPPSPTLDLLLSAYGRQYLICRLTVDQPTNLVLRGVAVRVETTAMLYNPPDRIVGHADI
jgi:hypothetical protein